MQQLYVGNLRPGCAEIIIPAQQRVLEACCELEVPVIVVEMVGAGKTITPLLDIILRCPKRDFVYKGEKNRPTCDGFSNPHLLHTLRKWNTSCILIMGINAAYCVKATIHTGICRYNLEFILSPNLIGGANSTRNFIHPVDDCVPYFRSIGVGVFQSLDSIISILRK